LSKAAFAVIVSGTTWYGGADESRPVYIRRSSTVRPFVLLLAVVALVASLMALEGGPVLAQGGIGGPGGGSDH
jgi:hypothetical protein